MVPVKKRWDNGDCGVVQALQSKGAFPAPDCRWTFKVSRTEDRIESRPTVLGSQVINALKAAVSVDHEIVRRAGLRNLEKKLASIARGAADRAVSSNVGALSGMSLRRRRCRRRRGARASARIRHYDRILQITQPKSTWQDVPHFRLFVLEFLSRLSFLDQGSGHFGR